MVGRPGLEADPDVRAARLAHDGRVERGRRPAREDPVDAVVDLARVALGAAGRPGEARHRDGIRMDRTVRVAEAGIGQGAD